MISRKEIRLGLIGAGGTAQTWSAAIKGLTTVELVVVADANMEAAAKMAAEHDAKAVSTLKDLEAVEFDALIVCTPPFFHAEHCNTFLKKGIHVLCEKPLAIDSQTASEMINTAKENNVVFTMASKFRFVEDVIKAKQLVDEGLIGETILYENSFTGFVDMAGRWNSNPRISGGGVLIDNGTHSLDIMRYFLGSLAEIRVVEGKRIQNLPVEDTVHLFVRTYNGTLGSIDLSWSLTKQLPNFVSLYGSNGTIHVGWQESKYRLKNEKEWKVFGKGYDKIKAFQNQLENFCGAIVSDQPLVITPEDGLASVCAVEAAYLAMQKSNWQPVVFTNKV